MGKEELGLRAIRGYFYNQLEAYFGSSWVGLLSMLFNSDQASETYKWLGMTPAMREWVGGRQAKGLRANGLTIDNKLFESTLDIPIPDLRRDKTGQIQIRVGELADRAGEHYAKLLSIFIINGTGATSGLCYDGQYFFDDDHSEGESGTQKNLLTATEVPKLDVGTPTAPTADEVVQAVLGVIAYMLGYLDDQGEPMNANAKEFLVMTSHHLMGAFTAGLFNKIINTGSGAVDNTLASLVEKEGFKIRFAVNPRLSAWTTQFAVFRTDARTAPLIRQEETKTIMQVKGANSDYAFDNNAYQFGVQGTHNVGYGYWQQAAHATLS
jgi:phage major head subunit gpT-like protein